ncbi:MAG: arylesterase [Rhodobacteraceae bacterium]|nr:arylesterase [Paracoccaceae bacterium]
MGDVLGWVRRRGYGVQTVGRNLLAGAFLLAAPIAVADEVVIAALGDSLTQGFGLVPEQGFVPQLEAWLVAQGAAARVINAGVSGDTTAGGLSRIAWTLTPEVDALIVALGGNDVLRGIDPAVARANMDGILSAARNAGVPIMVAGITAPPNYGPDYKSDFDAIYPDLSDAYGALLYPDFLQALTSQTDLAAALQKYMQPDGIHPNKDGVALIVEDMGPTVLELINQAGEI